QDSEFSNADQMDLYDDVLAATSQPTESRSVEPPPESRQEPSPKPNNKAPAILYTYSGLRNKRAAVYVGSFSWWTTDQQLIQTIRSVGVYDVVELKFAENRANGQSKGYAEVVVASENSVHKLLELLPGKILNGDKVEVRLATRQNLSQFEAQARKREPHPQPACVFQWSRTHSLFPPLPFPGCVPSLWHRTPLGSCREWQGPAGSHGCPAGLQEAASSIPPLILFGHSRDFHPSLGGRSFPSFLPSPLLLAPLGFCPFVNWGCGAMESGGDADPPLLRPLPLCSRELGPPPPAVTEVEFEEIMNRNRAISSSAISKAVSGASAGDYSDAIETLLTAIAVIKQSRVASDERCRVLLSSLKDCLHGIEAKSYSSGSGSSSSRKRHRSRERSPSRSRESSRRHRDLLHSEDRHEDYFQDRNREHERHRDRDRERDR
ncbi:CPSF7 factor, partial [Centropus unirufus]|nr:CPSF7 factor [Centropus unirufus]